jgi:nucleotide-binding universal stress UspA family protein
MALKTILVAASGGTASEGAVEIACRVAARTGAHLEALHVKTDPTQIAAMMMGDGFGMPISGEWFDRLIADSDKLAEKTEGAFAAIAKRHDLVLAAGPRDKSTAAWRVETGYAPIVVAGRARFFDLAVLGRSERVINEPHSDTIEETLMRSGRPVLLAPAKPPGKLGETIAVGWNGSPESVHALASSLPLLAKARTVVLITVSDTADEDVLSLRDYLGVHAIAATHRKVPPVKGLGPGEQLLAEARDKGADLLVMGGYGHRPWRETLFGGATRQIVETSILPILLMH